MARTQDDKPGKGGVGPEIEAKTSSEIRR